MLACVPDSDEDAAQVLNVLNNFAGICKQSASKEFSTQPIFKSENILQLV
jgi:hypothetical protein